jgi:hypothetical protein
MSWIKLTNRVTASYVNLDDLYAICPVSVKGALSSFLHFKTGNTIVLHGVDPEKIARILPNCIGEIVAEKVDLHTSTGGFLPIHDPPKVETGFNPYSPKRVSSGDEKEE